MIKTYAKNNTVVKAIQYNGNNADEIDNILVRALGSFIDKATKNKIHIDSLIYEYTVMKGDYIVIKDVNGHLKDYAVKKEEFEKTYKEIK